MPKPYDQDHDDACPCYFTDDMLEYLFRPHFALWKYELGLEL